MPEDSVKMCPFCGHDKISIWKEREKETHGVKGEIVKAALFCESCKARGPVAFSLLVLPVDDANVYKIENETIENAVQYWNSQCEVNVLRNELCIQCGSYKTAHLGSCDSCRWKELYAGKLNRKF